MRSDVKAVSCAVSLLASSAPSLVLRPSFRHAVGEARDVRSETRKGVRNGERRRVERSETE